jgi:hypothetical protein
LRSLGFRPRGFPSRAAGTLVPLAEARATFPRLPQVNFPNVLNALRLRDHSVEPPIESTAYPVFVQPTDADGNALSGISHPLLTVQSKRVYRTEPQESSSGQER